MATTTDLLFGVKGGGSLSGESGRQIESDLKAIVAKIEAKGTTKLKFTADTAGLQAVSRQMDTLQRQSAAFSRDMSGLLDGNIAKQQTLNRLMSQQLALQQQAGKAVSGSSAGKSGGGIGSALTGTMQSVVQSASNALITRKVNEVIDFKPVGRLKSTGHMNMPTHAPAATRSERAA